jgi:hypothetical protein
MSDNQSDLLLDAGTIIGLQKNQQNRWPSNSLIEARFDGITSPGLLAMSKFTINSNNINSNLWPSPRIPANGWFDPAPLPHILQIECIEPSQTEIEPAKSSQMVIDGTFESYKGYPATTFDATLFAYQELYDHPEWHPIGSQSAIFFNQHDNGNVGKLQRAKNMWDKIAQPSSNFQINWNNNQAAIKQKLEEIKTEMTMLNNISSSELQESTTQALATLNSELVVLQQTNQALSEQYIVDRNVRVNQLLNDLEVVTTVNTWEYNLKLVLTQLAQAYISPSGDLNTMQYATIQMIADQCRYAGGIGVVLARAKLGRYDYNDEIMCADVESRNNQQVVLATISPNPANEYCHISFNGYYTGQVRVINLQGNVQINLMLTDVDSIDLNTKKIPIGVYYIQLNDYGKGSQSHKLIIAR